MDSTPGQLIPKPLPMPVGAIAFYRPRYGVKEPSVIERLGALTDPELAERVAEWDGEWSGRSEKFEALAGGELSAIPAFPGEVRTIGS